MILNNLRITIDSRLVQNIEFNIGLNLITNKRGVGRSGNSVGKSTLSRVVDYLFLGAVSPIYIDEEFKKPNLQIESLFENSEVVADLAFTDLNNQLHLISRNICITQENQKFYVDGRETSEIIYEAFVQQFCFDVTTKRPSVRSIAPKFIRNNSHRMLNTTKFLDSRASAKDYSELFLYLFGFSDTSLLTEKREMSNLVGRKKKISVALNVMVREQKPSVNIKKYKAEIQELERNFLKFNYSPKYQDPIGYLSDLHSKETSVVEAALGVSRRIENINKTVDLLSQQGGNYLVNQVRAIYDFAEVNVDSAIKKYEEVLSFHDVLVSKKKQYLLIDLPEINSIYSELKQSLESIRQQKIEVFVDMRSEDSIANITKNLNQLGNLKIELGKLEGLIDQQKSATKDLADNEALLKETLEKISKGIGDVNIFLATFNKYFSSITNEIHAELYEFILKFNDENGLCDIDVKNKVPNPEGGKKKAEVISFDFAYICAVDELNARRPKFVFHDSIEDIDQKQIDIIFELAKILPGQQIISMLSDNLSDEMYEKYLPNAILLLSEENMFFEV